LKNIESMYQAAVQKLTERYNEKLARFKDREEGEEKRMNLLL
jgi:hypothetical protein